MRDRGAAEKTMYRGAGIKGSSLDVLSLGTPGFGSFRIYEFISNASDMSTFKNSDILGDAAWIQLFCNIWQTLTPTALTSKFMDEELGISGS